MQKANTLTEKDIRIAQLETVIRHVLAELGQPIGWKAPLYAEMKRAMREPPTA